MHLINEHGVAFRYLCIFERDGLTCCPSSSLSSVAGGPFYCFGVEVRVGSTCTRLPHLWLRFPIKPVKLCLDVAQCIVFLEPCGLVSKVRMQYPGITTNLSRRPLALAPSPPSILRFPCPLPVPSFLPGCCPPVFVPSLNHPSGLVVWSCRPRPLLLQESRRPSASSSSSFLPPYLPPRPSDQGNRVCGNPPSSSQHPSILAQDLFLLHLAR